MLYTGMDMATVFNTMPNDMKSFLVASHLRIS